MRIYRYTILWRPMRDTRKRRSILEELVEAGLSLNAMARELAARMITTRNGGTSWTAKGVSRALDRLEPAPAPAPEGLHVAVTGLPGQFSGEKLICPLSE